MLAPTNLANEFSEISIQDSDIAINIADLENNKKAISYPHDEEAGLNNSVNHDEERSPPLADDENENLESPDDYDPLELASVIALTDFGSYMMKKTGRAGESPEFDVLPYFTSLRRRWYFIIWEGPPDEWRIVSTRERIDDPYNYKFNNEEAPIYLKDISDLYLEPPPNLGIRLYRNEEVIQLSPISYSKSEARAWADAFRAAFALQDMNEELSQHVRQRYYELISHQTSIPPSGRRYSKEIETFQGDEIVLGDIESPRIPQSPSTYSQNDLIEHEPPPTSSAGCFSRWFGKK